MKYKTLNPRRVPSRLPKWTGKRWDMESVECPECKQAVGISGIENHRNSKLCKLQQTWLKRRR